MPEPEITIREFRPGDESAFRSLNEEWITRYFALEPKDEDSLAHPRETILIAAEGFSWRSGAVDRLAAALCWQWLQASLKLPKWPSRNRRSEMAQDAVSSKRSLRKRDQRAHVDSTSRRIESSRRRSAYMSRWAFAIFRPGASSPPHMHGPTFTWSCISAKRDRRRPTRPGSWRRKRHNSGRRANRSRCDGDGLPRSLIAISFRRGSCARPPMVYAARL
jgi:hypothetical protein